MRPSRRVPALLLALVLLAGARAPRAARAGGADVDLAKVEATLSEEIRRRMDLEGIPSVSVALIRGDEVVWTQAFGVANAWSKAPATPETVYSSGSTAKALVATAILQLVEAGKLTLDTPVNDVLAATPVRQPEGAPPITIRHLLTHTSGMVRGGTTVPLWDRALPPRLAEVPSLYEATRPPGVATSYSNAAYGVLGRVVEVVSGSTFEAFLHARVLEPLGMSATTMTPMARTVERMALPYQRTSSGLEPLRQVRFDVSPAGEVWTTAGDMARFLAAHLNDGALGGARLVTAAHAAEMHRRQFFADRGTSGYGLGFYVDEEAKDHRIIAHSGSIPGFVAEMRGDLDARVGVYLLANLDGANRPLEALARIALRLLRGEAYVAFDPVLARRVPQPATWPAYVGTYVTKSGAPARVRIETGALRLEVQGASLWLVPAHDDTFLARGDDAPDGLEIAFLRDAAGAVTGLKGPSGDVAPRATSDAATTMDLSKPPEGRLSGEWAGFVKFGGLKVDFSFAVRGEGAAMSGTVTLAAQGLKDSPVERLLHHGKEVHFEHGAGAGLATVDGILDGDALKGTIRRMGMNLPVEAYRVGSEAARLAAAARGAPAGASPGEATAPPSASGAPLPPGPAKPPAPPAAAPPTPMPVPTR